MTDHDLLRRLLQARSLAFGDFTLSSGQRSSYYIDARRTTMSAEGLAVIGRLGLATIRDQGWKVDSVGGLTMGADPVAYAIARASTDSPPQIDAFSVRKAAKEHGAKRRVEGSFEAGHRVAVIEDVITTGGSALQAIEALRAEGARIVGVIAVVDRNQGGRAAIQSASGLPVVSLTTIDELLPSKT